MTWPREAYEIDKATVSAASARPGSLHSVDTRKGPPLISIHPPLSKSTPLILRLTDDPNPAANHNSRPSNAEVVLHNGFRHLLYLCVFLLSVKSLSDIFTFRGWGDGASAGGFFCGWAGCRDERESAGVGVEEEEEAPPFRRERLCSSCSSSLPAP
jgi:hypothetical protein